MKISSNGSHLRIVVSLVTVVLVTFLLHILRIGGGAVPDFDCGSSSSQSVSIEIVKGESGSSIAQTLYKHGVVKSSQAFFRIAVGDSRSQMIAPGIHLIQRNLCASDALSQLLDSSRIQGLINITEGAWVSEVLPQLYSTGFPKADVAAALGRILKPKGFTSLEGLLFPAQYSFEKGTSATQALQAMIDRSVLEMKQIGFFDSSNDFSPQQLLTIASLVQAEGNTDDFAKISRVIRNRIKVGMPLQFDSTVHYIKKSRGKVFLSTESTLITSPYNTYKRYGLPPGPINNPGRDALYAALHPVMGDWLYFITVSPHDTRYTSDLNQFNSWKVEYKKNLRTGKFRSSK